MRWNVSLDLKTSKRTLSEWKEVFLGTSSHWCKVCRYQSETASGFTDTLFGILEKECPKSAISIMKNFKPEEFLKNDVTRVFSDWLRCITGILRDYPQEISGILKIADFIARGTYQYHAYGWEIGGAQNLTFSLCESLTERLEKFCRGSQHHCSQPAYKDDVYFLEHFLQTIKEEILKIFDGFTMSSSDKRAMFSRWDLKRQTLFFEKILWLLEITLPFGFSNKIGYREYYPLLLRMANEVSIETVHNWFLYTIKQYDSRYGELHRLIALTILDKANPVKVLEYLKQPSFFEK